MNTPLDQFLQAKRHFYPHFTTIPQKTLQTASYIQKLFQLHHIDRWINEYRREMGCMEDLETTGILRPTIYMQELDRVEFEETIRACVNNMYTQLPGTKTKYHSD